MAKRTSRKAKRSSRKRTSRRVARNTDKWDRSLQIGDTVTLPAGHRVGMGRLKSAVAATVFAMQDNDRGEPIYGVEWMEKPGKSRSTWIGADEAVRMRRNPRRNGYGRSYGGDPRWMSARFDGIDDEGNKVRKGDEVLYWPSTKRVQTGEKAKAAWRRFLSEKGDEEGTPYASNPRRRGKRTSRRNGRSEEARQELSVLLQDAPVGHIVDIRKLPKRLSRWIPHFHAVGVRYGNRTLLRTPADPRRPHGDYHPYLYVIGRDLTRNARKRRSR